VGPAPPPAPPAPQPVTVNIGIQATSPTLTKNIGSVTITVP
jgi:hypothetical protein